jgi:phage gp45-like
MQLILAFGAITGIDNTEGIEYVQTIMHEEVLADLAQRLVSL